MWEIWKMSGSSILMVFVLRRLTTRWVGVFSLGLAWSGWSE